MPLRKCRRAAAWEAANLGGTTETKLRLAIDAPLDGLTVVGKGAYPFCSKPFQRKRGTTPFLRIWHARCAQTPLRPCEKMITLRRLRGYATVIAICLWS